MMEPIRTENHVQNEYINGIFLNLFQELSDSYDIRPNTSEKQTIEN